MTELSKIEQPNAADDKYLLYIDGEFRSAENDSTLPSENPFTGEVWAEVPSASESDVDSAVKAARKALSGPWGQMTARERGKLLGKLADLLAQNAELLGILEAKDNGKLLKEMSGQTQYLPEWFHYFAGAADKLNGEVIPSERPNFHIYTRHEPVGVVGAITPWNSPLILLAFKLAPALAAGCTFIVKSSEHTPVSTLAFAKIVHEAGFPAGVFNVVSGGPEVGAFLSSHPGVNKLAFTGSDATGKKVLCSAAENFTRVSLELGGKSPNIVFEDADIDAAVNGIVAGVFAATGQSCMAGSRLVVHHSVKDELLEKLVARAKSIKLGDPMDPETEVGPMATRPQFEKVKGILKQAANDGATFLCGGGASEEHPGFFIVPTVVDDVHSEMDVVKNEIFGPVISVLTFSTEEEAIEIANDTRFGLAAGIWTSSVQRSTRVAHQVKAGTVWINAYRVVAPNVPFGGFGHSGIGRENGFDAMKQYSEVKAVWVETSGTTRDPFAVG
ncbi:aldehyde dehydrogenase [uncultured Tateyamaria sp.]|uniref:aldehyde dehydrogenase n=1 Tax=uncultured Tateyamaria sp. TaxID=455651 RepID=UPI002612CE14|nr:aldehyde dehydrogenase [uncultured Tateyamaria sp.]